MPVRAFGAPQTTCTGSPEPVSTRQTRSRSAFGCCFASMTLAMVNAPSAFALSSMFSTSSPIIVSLSASLSSGSDVSRCSLSQDRVNFIVTLRWRHALALPRSRGQGEREACSLRPIESRKVYQDCDSSSAQSSRQGRDVERTEAVMREPSHVGLEHLAQVGDHVFQHRDAVDAHAPSEPLVLV